ncbi:MAG: hypothetical protein WDO13_10555 [Verrucomicrobiota bacterium]
MKPILVAPSIISADFSYLRGEVARVNDSGADLLHVDIMDGHFVPNITFGPAITKTIKSLSKVPLDVHLMISRPRQYITQFVEAGAHNITFHVECQDQIRTAIDEVIYYSRSVGLCREAEDAARRREGLPRRDRPLLVMTVEPGLRRPEIHDRHDAEGEGSG